MRTLFLVISLFCSCLIQSQENRLLDEIQGLGDGSFQVKYVLNIKVDSIPENGFSKLLKIKLNSELNILGDLFAFYTDGEELKLSRKEQSILESRVLFCAHKFVQNKRYTIVKSSAGIAPIIGIDLDTIASKKVAVLHTGSDCIVTERDTRQEYIYELFSNEVRNLLNQ